MRSWKLVRQYISPSWVIPGAELSREEWMHKFRAWPQSHRTDTPLLSDEAISRESIYQDRGL